MGDDLEVGEFNSTLGQMLDQFRRQLIKKVISNIEIKNNLRYTNLIIDSENYHESQYDQYEGW